MKKSYLFIAMASAALATIASSGGKNLYADYNEVQDAEIQPFYCKDCKHYKNGKRYCKLASHSIKPNTKANNCKHFE